MDNQIETNLFEELSDADLMVVVGGVLLEGGGTAGTGVSVGQATEDGLKSSGLAISSLSNGLDAMTGTYKGTGYPSSTVRNITG
jgi:hypothetical protein